jgi:putative spermidine/putrescine transport system substrate-binding protein
MHKSMLLLYAGALSLAVLATPARAQTDITIVTWGGNVGKEMLDAWFKPATKELNVRIREDSLKSANDIRAHVASGHVTWDVVDAATDMCERGGRDGILEELDFNVVKTLGLPKEQVTKWSVPSTAYVTVLAYNKKKYGNNPPKTWQDFFDVKKFPGTRFFGPFVTGVVEIALLADGVAPDKLFPLDVDRAFRKLNEFKPNITAFTSSYGQSTQLMNDGEADMLFLPNNRLFAALRNGADYGYTYDQGIMNYDCLVIPKGSKNKQLAMQVIANVVSPEINARIVESSGLSPANVLSVQKGFVPAKDVAALATNPVNFAKVVVEDNAWWAENRDKLHLNERYNEFKAK